LKSHVLKGLKFGRLTVLNRIGTRYDSALWLCGCYCGFYKEYTTGDLCRKVKSVKSCGKCYDNKLYPSEWLAWRNMISRCENEDGKDYKNYGGRGITVCDEWKNEFLSFLIHVGLKPYEEATLDRINNNKGYEPGNVRWASRLVQNNNKRINSSNLSKNHRQFTWQELKEKYKFKPSTPP